MFTGIANELFHEFERMNRLFNNDGYNAPVENVFPAINVAEDDATVSVYAVMPGVDAATLDITLDKNVLSISGERTTPPPADDQQTYRKERASGTFQRVVKLPDDIDGEQVEASYENGVLHISVKRQAVAGARKIDVQVAA